MEFPLPLLGAGWPLTGFVASVTLVAVGRKESESMDIGTAFSEAAPIATTLAATVAASVALYIGHLNRAAKAGELMLPTIDDALHNAQAHLHRTVDVYRKLAVIDPRKTHEPYWDTVFSTIQHHGGLLTHAEFRSLRDRLVVVCGRDAYVTRAFDAIKPVHREYENARVAIESAATGKQRELVVRQYLEILYRAEKFALLSHEHLRRLSLGHQYGPADARSWNRLVRKIRRLPPSPIWSDFGPDPRKVSEQLARFRDDRDNPFGLLDDSVLLMRNVRPPHRQSSHSY